MPELVARMRVALRQGGLGCETGHQVLRAKDFESDLARRIVTGGGVEVHLTPTECGLVRFPGRTRKREPCMRSCLLRRQGPPTQGTSLKRGNTYAACRVETRNPAFDVCGETAYRFLRACITVGRHDRAGKS